MADFVRVPESDWQAICDAVREKTGGEEKLRSGAIAGKIAGIETGNDSGADVSAALLEGTLEVFESTAITKLRNYAFYQYAGLKKVIAPNLTNQCATNAFRQCSALELFDAPCGSLQSTCFGNCAALKTLVLRRADNICSLSNVNALTSTPFATGGTGGTVYVPADLVAAYQVATNWSTLYEAGTCNFVAIEGSEYE